MNRTDLANRYFQKKDLLKISHTAYAEQLVRLFDWMVESDVVTNDVTSKHLSIVGSGEAQIISKQEGIVAGIEEITYLLKKRTHLSISKSISDGERVKKGEIIAQIKGKNSELLAYERILLNILGRMSGIATLTARLVSIVQKTNNSPTIAATRKTPWMLLDKKAVAMGGGLTHRLHLADFALVKDTHVGMLKKQENINSPEGVMLEAMHRMLAHATFFEIEVKTVLQANAVLDAFEHFKNKKNDVVFALMLDNFTIKDASQFMKEIKKKTIYDTILIEASGEITEQNLLLWAKTGVDLLSMGALTHSSPTFNLSMIVK